MQYKTIPSHPKYMASACGKIMRKKEVVPFGNQQKTVGGKPLSPKTKKNGYLEVHLFDKPKQGRSRYVHRLVAEAWLGQIPKGFQVNHKDFDKTNNTVANLEIVSPSQNAKHAYEAGVNLPPRTVGSLNAKATTNEKEVLEIRDKHQQLRSIKALHRLYPHITESTLANICYRQCWKHI